MSCHVHAKAQQLTCPCSPLPSLAAATIDLYLITTPSPAEHGAEVSKHLSVPHCRWYHSLSTGPASWARAYAQAKVMAGAAAQALTAYHPGAPLRAVDFNDMGLHVPDAVSDYLHGPMGVSTAADGGRAPTAHGSPQQVVGDASAGFGPGQ